VNPSVLLVRNRQSCRGIDARFLRRIILHLMQEELAAENFELGVHLVGEAAMIRANEGYLQHEGCTDVITFDHSIPGRASYLHGDLLVCVPEAVRQAKLFRVTWQKELVRYIVHGMLHLRGYDDHNASDRRKMKGVENRVLGHLAQRFDLNEVSIRQQKPSRLR
jgi:probable rRNA maturation factor